MSDDRTYFIEEIDGDGNVKIGHSNNPVKRMKGFQTHHAKRLTIITTMPNSGNTAERVLHRKFKAHHIGGEWYQGEPVREWLVTHDQESIRRAEQAERDAVLSRQRQARELERAEQAKRAAHEAMMREGLDEFNDYLAGDTVPMPVEADTIRLLPVDDTKPMPMPTSVLDDQPWISQDVPVPVVPAASMTEYETVRDRHPLKWVVVGAALSMVAILGGLVFAKTTRPTPRIVTEKPPVVRTKVIHDTKVVTKVVTVRGGEAQPPVVVVRTKVVRVPVPTEPRIIIVDHPAEQPTQTTRPSTPTTHTTTHTPKSTTENGSF